MLLKYSCFLQRGPAEAGHYVGGATASRLPPFAFRLPPFAFCLLPFAFCLLPFASRLLPLALWLRQHSYVRPASQLGRPCLDERTTTLIHQTLSGRFTGLPDLVVCWLGCSTESLVKVRGEPQV